MGMNFRGEERKDLMKDLNLTYKVMFNTKTGEYVSSEKGHVKPVVHGNQVAGFKDGETFPPEAHCTLAATNKVVGEDGTVKYEEESAWYTANQNEKIIEACGGTPDLIIPAESNPDIEHHVYSVNASVMYRKPKLDAEGKPTLGFKGMMIDTSKPIKQGPELAVDHYEQLFAMEKSIREANKEAQAAPVKEAKKVVKTVKAAPAKVAKKAPSKSDQPSL